MLFVESNVAELVREQTDSQTAYKNRSESPITDVYIDIVGLPFPYAMNFQIP